MSFSTAPATLPASGSPETPSAAAPVSDADLDLIADLRKEAGKPLLDWERDYLRELRLSAEGKYFGLPLSQAHAKAAVAHIDQLIATANEREQMLDETLHDLVVAEMRVLALERMLGLRES